MWPTYVFRKHLWKILGRGGDAIPLLLVKGPPFLGRRAARDACRSGGPQVLVVPLRKEESPGRVSPPNPRGGVGCVCAKIPGDKRTGTLPPIFSPRCAEATHGLPHEAFFAPCFVNFSVSPAESAADRVGKQCVEELYRMLALSVAGRIPWARQEKVTVYLSLVGSRRCPEAKDGVDG